VSGLLFDRPCGVCTDREGIRVKDQMHSMRFGDLRVFRHEIGWQAVGLAALFVLLLGLFQVAALQSASATALSKDDIRHYEAAFLAAEHKKWPAAFRHAKRATEPLPGIVLQWLYFRDSKNIADFSEIAAFVESHPDWPYTGLLRQHAELRLKGTEEPQDILAFFKDTAPRTALGVSALATTLMGTGQRD